MNSTLIERSAASAVARLAKQYAIVILTGPRQAGKSTFARMLFPNKAYISLEDLDEREFASRDPRGFLARLPEGGILDEVQNCPDILSYIQTRTDQKFVPGEFILTGSAQLSLLSSVSQSLAGRAAIHHLLPFSLIELKSNAWLPHRLEEALFKGSYPPIYNRNLNSSEWHNNYIQTYVERDVRQILNVQDLAGFRRFLRLCAGRVGQIVNLSSLGSDCGVSHSTAANWLSILEATYIVFRLQPYFKNFSKRLIKSPKLYFYDTGLLCHLLGIQKYDQIEVHPQRGGIFESWVVSEMQKMYFNSHRAPQLYFWRDHKGLEVDLIAENGALLNAIEIKSGMTVAGDWFDSLARWQGLAKGEETKKWLVFGGDATISREGTNVISWRELDIIGESTI